MTGSVPLAVVAPPQPLPWDVIVLVFYSYAGLAVIAGAGVLALLCFVPAARGRLLPRQRQRAASTTPLPGLLVWIIYELYNGVFQALLSFQTTVSKIWAVVLAFPFQLASALCFLKYVMGLEYFQIGLTFHRWARDLVAGYVTWLIITPVVFGVYWLVLQGEPPPKHMLEQVIEENPTFSSWLLVTLLVVVCAPVLEELLFRGVFQPSLVAFPAASDFTMLAALLLALVLGSTEVIAEGHLASWWLLLLLGVAGPAYLAFEYLSRPWLPRPGAARAIYTTSLLFAALHFNYWPAPVPLFVLALGLGFLAYRTQTLIGPMLVHCLFNAVSLLQYLLQRMVGS